jgi:hypothetical protein
MNKSNCRAKLLCVSLVFSSFTFAGAQTIKSTPAAQSSDSAAKTSAVVTPAAPTSGETAAPVNPVAAPKKQSEASPESDDLNTSIEGIQISHEPGNKADEVVVSGYFIFKEKPVSYFYEVKQQEKKIVFEFNDTRAPKTRIPSVAEPPINKFTVEQRTIDINKDIRGLSPEFHNQVRVTFFLDNIPEIHVTDQSNVILFSYKWTTDPQKVGKYVLKSSSNGWIKYAIGGVAVAGAGTVYALKSNGSTGNSVIPISDLPAHNFFK